LRVFSFQLLDLASALRARFVVVQPTPEPVASVAREHMPLSLSCANALFYRATLRSRDTRERLKKT